MWNLLAEAHGAEDRTKAMDELFSSKLKPHLESLSKLLSTKSTFTGSLLAGDLAIFVIFDLFVGLQGDSLDGFTNLKEFYARVSKNEKVHAVAGRSDLFPYFKRNSDASKVDVPKVLEEQSPKKTKRRKIHTPLLANQSTSLLASNRCSSWWN